MAGGVTAVVPAVPFLGPPQGVNFNPGGYAAEMIEAALDAIDQLTGSGFFPEPIELPTPPIPPAPVLILPESPTFTDVDYVAPNAPAAFTGSIAIEDLLPETFDEDPPTLLFGSAPGPFNETAPTSPNVVTTFEDPGELTVELPAPPALLQLNITPFDGINMPTFTDTAPTIDLSEPAVIPFVPGTEYNSSLMSLLRSTFLTRVQEGGTGLPADVENAIWDRGREREAKAEAESIRNLERMEAMGFAFPSGVYLDARLRIMTESEATRKGLSREIMVKQAELEQVNINKALELGTQLEGQWLESWNKSEERRFQTAKYQTEAQVTIYNARVNAFQAMTEAYRAKVQVYEARVRAEVQKVEAYRAQVAAESAKADVNRSLVEQYKVQSDIALSAIEIYKARIAAIQTKAEIEKLKVEIFREQISAFASKVNAYTAQNEAYKAGISAEATKQDAFRSRVQVYSAQVEAAVKAVDARISEFKARIEAKSAEYDAYKAAIAGATARTQALSQYNAAVADQYRAETQANSAYNDALTKQWQAQLEFIRGSTEVAVTVAKSNAEIAASTGQVRVEAAKAAGQIAAQIGAAALSAYNISSSTAYSISNSSSSSGQGVDSTSNSVSDSTSNSVSQSNVNSVSKSQSDSRSFNENISDSTSRASTSNWSISFSNSDSKSYSIVQSESDSRSKSESYVKSDTRILSA